MISPYDSLPTRNFWKTGVVQAGPLGLGDLYSPKFVVSKDDKIATAGSCFAQHIGRRLKGRGFQVLDCEPPPAGLPNSLHGDFGYSVYSARYGNIYTIRQLLQLVREAHGEWENPEPVWTKDGRCFDAQRPSIEAHGFESTEEVLALRKYHLACVRKVIAEMDVLVFTLGLTEAWMDANRTVVYPSAPGVVAGEFSASRYMPVNFRFQEMVDDFRTLLDLVSMRRSRPGPVRVLLTVSPVPLTATSTGDHVLVANTRSKALLRAVAGELAADHENVDYFPSFEVITNPAARSSFYQDNLRVVTPEGVDAVMRIFFAAHHLENHPNPTSEGETRGSLQANPGHLIFDGDDVVCEEALLERYGS